MRNAALFLILVLCGTLALAAEEDGFKPIFNGENLEGWEGDSRFWSVEEGAITGRTTQDNPTEHNTFLIWRQGEVDDFVLRFSYRIVGGNSGVQYRSKEVDPFVMSGYQADLEAGDNYSGINYEEKGRGILAQRGQKTTITPEGEVKVDEQFAESSSLQGKIKNEDWNDYEITVKGNHLVHKINGQVMSEVTDEQPDKRQFSGLLGLQVHAGPPMKVQFKDIRLKRTPLEEKKK
jgi:hypothetical protein